MKRTKVLPILLVLIMVVCGSFVYAAGSPLVVDLCETEIQTVKVLAGTPDGSKYYQTTYAAVDFPGLGADSMDELIWSMDIRFDVEGSGFTPMGSNDKWGTCVRSYNNEGEYYHLVGFTNSIRCF